MLKVAVAATEDTVYSMIPALFEDTTHLLIIDADTDRILNVIYSQEGTPPLERSVFLAKKVAELDCEALLCGALEPEPFRVLAEENCITRYMAAELNVLDGINWMNNNSLDLITDYIGGTGCPDNDPANCESHQHEDIDDLPMRL